MILGYDVAGHVVATGEDVTHVAVGDNVFYAGSPVRPGGNAELQLVDERLVGRKPDRLSFAHAATVPLAYLTAYEALGDGLDAWQGDPGTILVSGGAGRVATAAIQLLRALSTHRVVASAGDARSAEAVLAAGAHQAVRYREDLRTQFKALDLPLPDRILSMRTDAETWPGLVGVLSPYGRICAIDRGGQIDLAPLVGKGGTLSTEGVFNRSLYRREPLRQRDALQRIATLIDDGQLSPPPPDRVLSMDCRSLAEAHRAMAARTAPLRIALEWRSTA